MVGGRRPQGIVSGRAGTDGWYRYNLDAINGAPFKGLRVSVSSEGGESIEWPNGEDEGEVTRNNAADKDIVLTVSSKA